MINNINKTYDVIILTYMPSDEIISSLTMLLSQTMKPHNIIICNTEKDLFYKKIKNKEKFDNIINSHKSINDDETIISLYHITKKEFDHGKTRNDAFKKTNADYVLFMTQDAVPYDNMLSQNLINAFYDYDTADNKVAVSYARQIPKKNAKFKEKLVREYNYPDYDIIKEKIREKELGIKNYFCSNVCAMYDSKIFTTLGYFEENIILNEDTFYVYNAIQKGYKIVYKSDARVFHSHNLSYKKQYSRNFDIGVSQKQKKEIFDNIPSEKEGKKLLKYVVSKSLKSGHIFAALDFAIECLYRLAGFNMGKIYDHLNIVSCIKYADNKDYFIKRLQNGNYKK